MKIRSRMTIEDNSPAILNALNKALDDSERRLKINVRRQIYKVTGIQHYSLRQLREKGYPYSRRQPNFPTEQGIINKQSGNFHKSFKIETSKTKDLIILTVSNDYQPVAKFLVGTKRMKGRYYGKAIRKRIEPVFQRAISKELPDSFKLYLIR